MGRHHPHERRGAGRGRGLSLGGKIPTDPRETAIRLLQGRDHSRHELRRKLLARGVPEEEAEDALRYVAAMGYLDDGRFARQYVRQRAGRGVGRLRLLEELAVRGVDRELAAQVMQEADLGDEGVRALDLARERAHRGRTPEQTARFLSGRGFSCTSVRWALQQAYPAGSTQETRGSDIS